MKLNKQHKENFINDVMAKIPTIDYHDKAQKLAQQISIDLMPANVKAVYDDENTREYLFKTVKRISLDNYRNWVNASLYCKTTEHFKEVNFDKVTELLELNAQQNDVLKDLRMKLMGICNACSTLKQLKEALPEFEEFMPKETEQTRNLPAIANVVGDFMAAGLKLKGTAAA